MSRSWVDTEYSIHWVQHPPKIVCVPFILRILSWPLNVASASGVPPCTIYRHQPALHESPKIKSPCYIPTVASQLTDETSFSTLGTVHWLPRCTSSNSLNCGLQVRTIMPSKTISKLTLLLPPNSLNHGLQVYLQTRLITASKCISKFTQSQSRSASLSSLDQGRQVYLQISLITTSKCISKLGRSQPWTVSMSSLDRHSQAHLQFLPSTTCSQSRYTVCRWVAI